LYKDLSQGIKSGESDCRDQENDGGTHCLMLAKKTCARP
jgi:hypothetical protein